MKLARSKRVTFSQRVKSSARSLRAHAKVHVVRKRFEESLLIDRISKTDVRVSRRIARDIVERNFSMVRDDARSPTIRKEL